LRDKAGKLIKDDEGKGLIPDFVLHFPNHRDVVVDSKMSFTAYDRYVNSADPEEQTRWLKEHIASVRAQVERLAKKDYSRYVNEGYNKLNFVIMYIHTEGALNLALMNDGRLWKEAYDKGVLILGPQTMYMNLRILEMMWTQVRQLSNQEDMIKAASMIIDRTQDFAMRFAEVESKMRSTVDVMEKLKITTSNSGASIITAAKNLIKAGGRENKKKKSIMGDVDSLVFFEDESAQMLANDATMPVTEG
jgi:DNA anti-recombination protein RmuC